MCPKCLLAGARVGMGGVEVGVGGVTQSFAQSNDPKHPVPKPAQIAGLFPELEILDVIGHGGMGVVYKARQKSLGREVAVKLLSTALQDDPAFAERFTREARAMAVLNHPNIISIFDFGQRGPYHFLVMEFVDGLNLRQLLKSGGMEPAEAMQMVPQLCDALQYAHDNGIVHRDIKPENVLLSQSGHVKIADFGLAKLANRSANDVNLTRTQQVMGTLNYMAPEQMERPTDVDHRADIYSLGVVIYELLTGELPLGRFSPPSQKARVDSRLDEVVLRALEKEPSLRYQQVSELKTGVQSLGGQPIMKKFGGTPHDQQFAGRIAKFIWLGVALTFCVVGALFIVLGAVLNSGDDREMMWWIGFPLMGVGGLLFALIGIFNAVFADYYSGESNPSGKSQSGDASEDLAPAPGWLIGVRAMGTGLFFLCGVFFVASALEPIPWIDDDTWRFMGIATAILGAFVHTVAGMISSSRGFKDE